MNNAAENRERKILVVDDDPAVRRIVIEALKNQDYQVYDVGSGKDALELILAGASAVAVGTANFWNPRAAELILKELTQWVEKKGKPLRDLVGAVKTA
jgi:dihydroorotate dehydrogenase (NAD+) catalytic subunit